MYHMPQRIVNLSQNSKRESFVFSSKMTQVLLIQKICFSQHLFGRQQYHYGVAVHRSLTQTILFLRTYSAIYLPVIVLQNTVINVTHKGVNMSHDLQVAMACNEITTNEIIRVPRNRLLYRQLIGGSFFIWMKTTLLSFKLTVQLQLVQKLYLAKSRQLLKFL